MKLIRATIISSSIVIGLFVAACGADNNNTGIAGGSGVGNKSGSGGTHSGGSGGTIATGGTSASCAPPGSKQCSGNTPQTCDSNGTWKSGAECPNVCSAGACTGVCAPGTGQCNGLVPQMCDPTGTWVDGAACQFACTNGACTGVCMPGELKCKLDIPQTCGTDGTWQIGAPCPYGCDGGVCKDACKPGEFHCEGNEVQQCDPGPPPQWVSMSPQKICDPYTAGQKCDAATGTCVTLQITGTKTPTGTYYQYATLNSTQGFKGGYDVDSYDDLIYVNRSGTYMDVYKVTLLDSDGDGKLEPDQHPSNPHNPGPVEQRTLTLVTTYSKATDNVPLGPASTAELYALSDRVFSLGPQHDGTITEYLFATKTTTPIATPANMPSYNGMSHLGFGDLDGLWYASNESNRRVYSYHVKSQSWVAEFAYPDLAGSHMDGMEVIVSPKTGEQYVFVSDMTSDFLGQYKRDPSAPGGWVQVNLFQYNDVTGQSVEGMGFGALNHFWASGGTYLYEIGGGDLAKYLE